ncbi:4-hydroxythreonine-4-phosphate dehydrogenase PdxA [Roseospira marina]|uniref:4-hydroxythreonine-4-phosphate dehydrogenase PdxA n=1 Tax=Roseospira marina TaxID=140057 RepID=A0A5M6I939_9PROT|nr:4-hydroxythreonine-4-phosphate dehydrogenase PdxA [Roseospira marina]KAA5604259.1 4-hydroxythreonine-4-phosphate dehydrogenase PdxA [Roseospira marina]MBB4315591.1 4-hydroxythreonine-4-phosphate dehydrogenase [Roseospira marina]MBB5088587.1 4-hydroxythreonine-4-phosphate dehydrogenase [Roseospira marina]
MQKTNEDSPIVGILLGDASGCGPEVIAKLAAAGTLTETCRPILIGDARVFAKAQTYAGVTVPTAIIAAPAEARWEDGSLPVLDLKNLDPATFALGEVSADCGRAVGETLTTAIKLALANQIDGILYAPIHKQALYLGGFTFESEEALFASLMETEHHGEINILGNLWTTRVTSHIPLKDVSDALTQDRIEQTIAFGHDVLTQAGFDAPRLGVAALNPHAGENGKCGREEIDVIAPAVEAAAARGIDVRGPLPADTAFTRAFSGEFDMVVTLYHDQGQIALKTKNFSEGVTVAGGFPVPICTPAHGTAFDKAGTGTVNTRATENALGVCCRMSAVRRNKTKGHQGQ